MNLRHGPRDLLIQAASPMPPNTCGAAVFVSRSVRLSASRSGPVSVCPPLVVFGGIRADVLDGDVGGGRWLCWTAYADTDEE